MARRARMVVLLQLSSLVFLLVAEVTHTAPISGGSGINTIGDDGDRVLSEEHDDVAHTVAPNEDKPGDSVAESDHHATTVQDVNSVSKEEVHSMVTKAVDDASSEEDAKENVAIDVEPMLTRYEDGTGAAEESEEVSEENHKHKDSLSIKSEGDAGAADSSPAVPEDKHEDSVVTKSGENGDTTESSNVALEENAGNGEDHASTENDEVTSTASEESAEMNEDLMTTKSEENTHDAESKENVHKVDGSIIGITGKDASTPEESEEVLKENTGKYEAKAIEGEPSKEQIGTAVAGDASNEDSERSVESFKGKTVEQDAVESSSSDKGSKENEATEESALNKGDTSEDEDEVSEEGDKKVEGEHGDALGNSSEEISDAEDETGDIEVNENQSSTHQDSHVTSSPFARLSVPSSDSHHVGKDERHSDTDAAVEGHRNPSLEETAEDEDKVSEESNEEMEGKHGATLENSSEETSDSEDEAEDTEVNENQSSTGQESHVTSSPFAQLSVPPSDSHHIGKDEQHSDIGAPMEGHERNPSVEETAENEPGSPDELIENDKVDSEVIKSDNKTAALGKAMPITGAEEDSQNKDESLKDTSKDSETVVLKELENTEGKNSIEQDLSNENEEEDETTINGAPENKHESESKEIVLGGKLVDNNEENEKDNFLDKDDIHPKAHLAHFSENNQDGFDIDEDSLNIVHATENPFEVEGSGITPGMIGFSSHGGNDHKDMSETSSQEKHEAEISDRNKDETAEASEKEETKLSKETRHHTDGFGDPGSGHNEEEHDLFGKQDNNGTDDVEDGPGSGGHALPGHYEDGIATEEHTTKSNVYSVVSHIPIIGDNEESSAEYPSESPASESETSTKIVIFEQDGNQNESGNDFREENLAQNNTNVHAMSMNPTPLPNESDNQHVTFDGSGDDDTTTPEAVIIHADIIDDNMPVSSMEMDLVNSSVIGEASPAYQEKPAVRVISPQLAAAPPAPTTEVSCIADEENDCLLQSSKPHEDAGITNILEDDDEVPPEPTKGGVHTKSSNNDLEDLEAVISTTPAVKVSSEEESSPRSIAVDLNKLLLHSNKESSTSIAPEIQEITEPIEDHEAMDNDTTNIGAPDTIVEHPLGETGIKEMSGKIRAANVNELGVSGQENSDDLGEPEALDSSSASGSYVVLGCIMAVVIVLLAYAAIKSRRERGTNTSSKKQSEVAGDDDDGTELKDMKKALLPPETPGGDDCNGDIEANRKPLMDKHENQEEDEEKEPIIKQNGTLELSESPRDVESQVDSSTAENQLKTAPTPSKPQQRNGLSEVVVEKPAMSNGKTDSIITHPVAAKVKVIENEDSIAKTPVIINRGGNSPPH